MAHEVEFVGQWHGTGTVLDTPPTVEQAIALARLDWEVSLEPLYGAKV